MRKRFIVIFLACLRDICSNDKRPGHRQCPGRSTTTRFRRTSMAESHSSTDWKEIPLTQGQVAIVDAADYGFLMRWKWYASWCSCTRSFYARSSIHVKRENGRKINRYLNMGRVLLGITNPDVLVDHENHDTLDYRRCNLRPCTGNQNAMNCRRRSNNTSGHIGVCFCKRSQKWAASIFEYGKRHHLGYYANKDDAVAARLAGEKHYHGEFSPQG